MDNLQSPLLAVQGRMEVRLASMPEEVEAAQRLRFEVFNKEQGVGLWSATASGLDRDEFDAHCDHLLVIDHEAGRVVGTYRLLPQDRVPPFGFYSETEFDLSQVKASGLRLLELGRSCVAAGYRDGRTLDLLFHGIGAYIRRTSSQAVMGCASIHGRDVDVLRQIYATLLRDGLVAAAGLEAHPRPTHAVPGVDVPPENLDPTALDHLPPPFRTYLKLGARVCGLPAYDPLFGTTDFFVLLDKTRITNAAARRFLS